ncbi:MAG: hypothetical protein HRU13_11845 [Phycisphaerales bacterium]|nr:hypothetical protein [Phycisphaerales bacterium]
MSRLNQASLELDQLKKIAAKLTPTQAESMTTLQFEIMTGQTRLSAIYAAIQKISGAYKRLSKATLSVDKNIMPGVTIVIGNKSAVVREPIRGPVEIALDESGTLVMKQPSDDSVIPLSTKAKLVPASGVVDVAELERLLDNPLFNEVRAAA